MTSVGTVRGTLQSGNTCARLDCSAGKNIKSRAWMITLYDDSLTHFDSAVYECWCNDTCKNGLAHMHQAVYFKNPVSFNSIKRVYASSHIEKARSIYDCIKYISNTNCRKYNFQEIGERPVDTRYKSTLELINCSNVIEIPWQQVNIWKRLKSDIACTVKLDSWNKAVKVIYIHGDSGRGKSKLAKDKLLELGYKECNIVKYENGFWNGISSAGTLEACIYDDWRDSHMKASEFINFIDYNVHSMNIKGGSIMNLYKTIIITTVQKPSEIYRGVDNEPRRQWERRMEFIDLGHTADEAIKELLEDVLNSDYI